MTLMERKARNLKKAVISCTVQANLIDEDKARNLSKHLERFTNRYYFC